MEIILSITYALLFFHVIRRNSFFRIEGIPEYWVTVAFLVKLMAGVSVGLIYTYYYTNRLTADTFRFFDDSKVIFDAFFERPEDFFRMISGIGASAPELEPYYNAMYNWYDVHSPINDNRTMIRFNALMRFISFGNYYVHVVIGCFLSFVGIVALIKTFSKKYAFAGQDIFLTFTILPSLLFWSSGLLKDSLVFFPLGLAIYMFSDILSGSKPGWQKTALFFILLLCLMVAKFQIFMLCIPLMAAWGISAKSGIKPLPVFLLVLVFTVGILEFTGKVYGGIDIARMLSEKQAAFYDLAVRENAGSVINIPDLKPHLSDVIMNAVPGFWNAVTRPFFTDPGPVLSKIFTIENMLVLIFMAWRLLLFKRGAAFNDPVLLFCLFYAVIYLSVVGMVTPILGAMVRYKTQAIPFLLTWFILMSSTSHGQTVTGMLKRKLNKS